MKKQEQQKSIEIPIYRTLSNKETITLIKQAQNGDIEARNKILNHNYKRILSLIAKYIDIDNQDFPDIFQAGCEGVIKAIETFNLNSDIYFSTHAAIWIKRFIRKTLHTQKTIIYIPPKYKDVIKKIEELEQKYLILTGNYPTTKQLSEELGINEKIIKSIKLVSYPILSLDEQTSEEENEPWTEITTEAEEIMLDEERINEITEILKNTRKLSTREKVIFKMLNGLDGYEVHTREELARMFNLTVARIGQINQKCIRIYKKIFEIIDAKEAYEEGIKERKRK